MRHHAANALALVLMLTGVQPGSAQAQNSVVVRVRVTDTAKAPLRGADVIIVRDSSRFLRILRTDDGGRLTFSLERDTATYRISARQIGYRASSRDFKATKTDTISFEFSLERLPARLDTVRVTQRALPLAKQPFVGADEIARDKRSVLSLRDVVLQLRPDIDYQVFGCQRVRSLPGFISGPIPKSRVRRPRGVSDPPNARVYVNGTWIPPEDDPWNSIHAEHIEQLVYVNCNDRSIPGLAPSPFASIYVVLKNGVEWDPKNGSQLIRP